MRFLWRTSWLSDSPGLLRDIGLVCLADGIVGVSFGAAAVAGGLPWWVPVALSVLVFAGGSQIAAVGVVLAGGSPFAAVAAGAVLNTRLFPYGLAVADVIRPGRVSSGIARPDGDHPSCDLEAGWPASGGTRRRSPAGGPRLLPLLRQLLGTHLITDEAVAFALRQAGPHHRRTAFWACGVALFAIWNLSVLAGVAAGSAIGNTDAFGLDATFPAVMLALALPTLVTRPVRIAAGTGAVLAVALTPVLPAGLPLLAALGGLATRWPGLPWSGARRTSRGEPDSADGSSPTDFDAGELTTGGGR